MQTLVIVVAFATIAIPALTEVGSASQAWHLSVSNLMAVARYAALIGLVGMVVALTASIIGESANAAGYSQANPHYGFGPRVRVQPNDVISGDRLIGRDPDPFIRGQILRGYK